LEGVDAIFDIVDSGRTIKENGLEIVADNLQPVSIGAVWRREAQAEPAPESLDSGALFDALATIEARVVSAQTGKPRSYTERLAANPSKLVKKLAEESGELLEAFLVGTETELLGEVADVLYALSIACSVRDTSLSAALATFARRNK